MWQAWQEPCSRPEAAWSPWTGTDRSPWTETWPSQATPAQPWKEGAGPGERGRGTAPRPTAGGAPGHSEREGARMRTIRFRGRRNIHTHTGERRRAWGSVSHGTHPGRIRCEGGKRGNGVQRGTDSGCTGPRAADSVRQLPTMHLTIKGTRQRDSMSPAPAKDTASPHDSPDRHPNPRDTLQHSGLGSSEHQSSDTQTALAGGSVVRASPHGPKGLGFDSWSRACN